MSDNVNQKLRKRWVKGLRGFDDSSVSLGCNDGSLFFGQKFRLPVLSVLTS
jgi:hypothetical protein